MSYPQLQALDLSQHYGPTPALDHLSITIDRGESVAIMGPSGSGKTTLLHALAGIDVAQSGEVIFHGADRPVSIHALSSEQRADVRLRHFGFVFQQGLMLSELTVVENVALPLMLCGVDRASAQQTVSAWLNRLGLAGMEDRRLGELSGGQAQRVAVARAQVCGPDVVFADEPTGALDSVTSGEVLHALLESSAEHGTTLVVVTHDESVAARCGRTVRLRDGQVVSDTAVTGVMAP
ncbi:ABC transporter ATP-binding protein [Kocuria coralli]|uniref:ABC transporter ATP-binding protein n=1 Tax=Kocuria coralli TaxID=1461025 RepID=A0A5J5KVM9_9MICC|nr:ABC transporter ATP-binding protein [Kocuria coralli]KAA9392991.1 ABC transporter ATP-binding protein [Kocuria coralli]